MHFVTGATFSCTLKILFLFIVTFVTVYVFLNRASEKITIIVSYKSAEQPNQATWRTLIPSELYVYSAFYALSEDRTSIALFDIVKVIAVVKRKDKTTHEPMNKCQCVYANKTVDAVLAEFPEHHNEIYTAAAFTCKINDMIFIKRMDLHCQTEKITGFLSFDMAPPPWMGPKPLSFVMCGPIVFGNGTKAEHITEFVEYYAMMGVSQYIFYLMDNSSEEVLMVLRYYEKKGMMNLMNWTIPEEIENQVHYNGQLAALNECRLRVAGRWDYMVTADFDEFILSSRGTDLETIVQNGFHDCIVIRHTLAKSTDVIISSSNTVYEPRLIRYLQRDSRVWPVGDRSKYICRAQSLLIAGIHFPHIIRFGTRILIGANPDESVVLHFREERIEETDSQTEVDMSRFFGIMRLRKFTDSVNSVLDHIFKSARSTLRRRSNVTGSVYRTFRFLL